MRLGWACRKLWRRAQDRLRRPQFHTLLTSGRPKQIASSRFCSHTVQRPAKPKPLRSHSMASKPWIVRRQLRDGDTLVVWKLDRLSRSLKDMLHTLERVEAVGARFRSLTEAVDTAGPAGRMLMQMLGSFAEFERAMVRERTRAGLKAAAARGRKGGRQPKLTPEQKTEILDGLGSGRKSAADLARLPSFHKCAVRSLKWSCQPAPVALAALATASVSSTAAHGLALALDGKRPDTCRGF